LFTILPATSMKYCILYVLRQPFPARTLIIPADFLYASFSC